MVKVYRYGLLPPTENGAIVMQQLLLAHRYRNFNVEVARGQRAVLRELLDRGTIELSRKLLEAEQLAAEAARAIKAARAASRSRSDTASMGEQLKAARAHRKEIAAELRAKRKEVKGSIAEEQRKVKDRFLAIQRAARKHCGVYWGTYQLVEEAAGKAAATPLYDGTEPRDPHFVRWTREGQVGVQIQGKVLVGELMTATNMYLRIDMVEQPAKFSRRLGCDLPARTRPILRLRVGSRGRSPIWATWPLVQHRPLPENGIVTGATVSLRRNGPKEIWSTEITVRTPAMRPKGLRPAAVAVDIGWRVIGDEIRVAAWGDEAGNSGEIRLDSRMIRQLTKADSLKKIRADSFNELRKRLTRWMHDHEIPEWLQVATARMPWWHAPAKLVCLRAQWRSTRFENDAEMFEQLDQWCRQDHHLWEWESCQRTKALRHRREQYRIFAAGLVSRYGTVVLEDFDLRRVAKRASADAEAENATARYDRVIVSPSELRNCIKHTFKSCGGTIVEINPAFTTLTCSACRSVESFDAAASIAHTCSSCGSTWDQDENAWSNLLTRWRELPGDAQNPGGTRAGETANDDEAQYESTWARGKRLRAEREAQQAHCSQSDPQPVVAEQV